MFQKQNARSPNLSKLKMYRLRLQNIADPIYIPHYPQQVKTMADLCRTPIPLSMER